MRHMRGQARRGQNPYFPQKLQTSKTRRAKKTHRAWMRLDKAKEVPRESTPLTLFNARKVHALDTSEHTKEGHSPHLATTGPWGETEVQKIKQEPRNDPCPQNQDALGVQRAWECQQAKEGRSPVPECSMFHVPDFIDGPK